MTEQTITTPIKPATQKERSRKSYLDRKEHGLCPRCGKPIDRDGVYCIECRRKKTEDDTANRHWYQEHGICPRCGKNNLFGDEKNCPECTAKDYVYTMRSREKLGSEHYNKQHSKWARINYHKRTEQGICARCGKRKADVGFKTCGICRAKTREYKRMKYGKPDRRERTEKGICYFCDSPVKDGYKVCEKHYRINLKNLQHEKCREATERIKKSI